MTRPDIYQMVKRLEDIDELKTICRGIIGQESFYTRVRFGWSLCLEIGEKIPASLPSMRSKGVVFGSWSLVIHTSNWRIENNIGMLHCSPDTIGSDLNVLVQALNNTNVVSFKIGYPSLGLDVTFENGYRLVLITCEDFEDNDKDEVIIRKGEDKPTNIYVEAQCWELFTPEKMVVQIGPFGHKWSYTSSQ